MDKEKKKIGIIAIIIIILAITIFTYIRGGAKELKKNDNTSIFVENNALETEADNDKNFIKEIKNKKIVVEIKGEVNKPDVYELNDDSIVKDLIDIAGGITEKAEISNINRAKKLQNHELIYISNKNEILNKGESLNNTGTSLKNNGKININSSSMEELKKIPGIGDAKAKKIIEYRENIGLFNSIEDLRNIDGIGEKMFEKLKNEVEV
ncbi:helix-hairpin-helix domain-containing protein [Clostridium weizhouense]|uniref:Helix-hairpin-helix domain-containing protein n=1 Tax=Clostridium weizhouense TaxID=2859781 RepID=A0ABS7AJF3_9CLOT|nr:helix-hairpin-helix domain-containing protein [Clostridium weizhouense]MBW6408803.1 helix-hairpin-helix domain-containing protein [Clostridium weizhouense]